ncbi:MAG: sugar transferase [Suipraeoptans sp.]
MHKLESFKRLILIALAGICLILESLVFYYFWMYNFRPSITTITQVDYFYRASLLQSGFYFAILFFLSHMYGGMKIGYLKSAEVVFSQAFSTIITNILIYAQLSIMAKEFFKVNAYFGMTILQILIVLIWNNIACWIYKTIFPPRKMIMIHGERSTEDIANKFQSRKDKYNIVKYLYAGENIESVKREVLEGFQAGEFQAVVIGDVSAKTRNDFLKLCYAHSIRIYIIPKITDVILKGAEELHLFDTPIFLTREYRLTMEQRFVKRAIDFTCASILAIITSPIMLITAVIIKANDGGPVLYKQVRCTTDRKEFSIMKFRSMCTDAEADGVARLAKKNDSRITPIGKFIRKVRIDELPQLFNIIKGDMSFIGPRPERPEIIEQYTELMPEFVFRTKVKAGLAGYAQVYGKYNTSPYNKLKLDLTYIENYSIWLDVKLMLLTLKILFWPDSTEGVESEQITAMKQEIELKKKEQQNKEQQNKEQ